MSFLKDGINAGTSINPSGQWHGNMQQYFCPNQYEEVNVPVQQTNNGEQDHQPPDAPSDFRMAQLGTTRADRPRQRME